MANPTVVADRPDVFSGPWEFALAVILLAAGGGMSELAMYIIQFGGRITQELRLQSPDVLPDLGWRAAAPFIKRGSIPSLVAALVAPLTSVLTALALLLFTGQPWWPAVSMLNMMATLYAFRSICMMVTYLPPAWSKAEALGSGGLMRAESRYTIIPSGHTIALLFPLVFCALLMSDGEDRSMALMALFFVAIVPVFLVFGTRIHHTVDVVVAIGLCLLSGFVAVDNSVDWVPPVAMLAVSLIVLGWNFQAWGLPGPPGPTWAKVGPGGPPGPQ